MKKLYFSLLLALLTSLLSAQVSTIPAFIPIGYDGEITVVFNPTEGSGGMVGATQCYAHTGVISNGQTWQHVIGTAWRNYPDKVKLTKNSAGNWELKITPNVREFYGCSATETITGLCFVFNDGANGSKEGKTATGQDIFLYFTDPAEGLVAKINSPASHQLLTSAQTLTIDCASSVEADLKLLIDGVEVQSGKGTTLSTSYNFNKPDTKIEFTATANGKTATDTRVVAIMQANQKKARPAGIDMGIYYNKTDLTRLTLSTYAASKTEAAKAVYVVGDFNDWTPSSASQMYQDGNYFWLELTGLVPHKEYAFQYLVVRSDGVKKYLSDLFSEKLLHPDDKYEPKTVNPGLMDYPEQADGGYVTVVETGKSEFQWSDATKNFRRPDKNNLIIYETWIYDFTPFRSIRGLMERLDYIEGLGVNAVELMPVTEFDGNYNWGYSPNHYFAVDKAYGSGEQLKTFIDECHKRGIAVILDMVFNHATGLNPMNKLYPYGTDLAKNPWFNVTAPHPDNVYEDWNHDFQPAHQMFIRALKYWIEEYKVDGYRMDLSHGLCGASYNAVSNLKDYYEKGVKAAAQDAYFILEHWGNNMGSDRPELVNAGMLCWENTVTPYEQLAMGYMKDGDDLSRVNKDGYVSYCTNHDEERPYAKAKLWGDGKVATDEAVRCSRVPLTMAFLNLLNGSHLFYHYEELGFDYSKWQNASGQWGTNPYKITAVKNEEFKMQIKARPEDLNWFSNAARLDAYKRTAQVNQLRTRLLPNVFAGNPTAVSIGSGKALRTIQWGQDVFVVGNFSATATQQATLPSGTWYDYFAQTKASSTSLTLQPGELKIFTGKQLQLPQVSTSFAFSKTDVEQIDVTFEAPYDVYVYTMTGQLVLSEKNAQQLPHDQLQSGMYIIRLQKDSQAKTLKIVK